MTGNAPESSPAKSKKLPQSFEILDRFFGSLDSSIRLLPIKGSGTTFSNIRPKVECLTDSRFTLTHLSQIKYIFPEAIQIRKMLVRDEHTACMKPDLHISLDAHAVQDGQKPLRKVFRSRLLRFFNAHPDVDEIPEADLMKPFNPPQKSVPNAKISAIATPVKDACETRTRKRRSFTQPAATSMSARRRLFDTPEIKNAKNGSSSSSSSSCSAVSRELVDVLPEGLIQSIMEKEKMAQAKRRQQMIARLPKLFDMIHLLFQSARTNTVFTINKKDDIIHRMISNPVNIVDGREAEEQLKLLMELLPEWIQEKSLSSNRDVRLCVNHNLSPELLRNRLAEAK